MTMPGDAPSWWPPHEQLQPLGRRRRGRVQQLAMNIDMAIDALRVDDRTWATMFLRDAAGHVRALIGGAGGGETP